MEEIIKTLFKKYEGNYSFIYAEVSTKLFQLTKKGINSIEDKKNIDLYRSAKQFIKDLIIVDYMKKKGFVSENLEEWTQGNNGAVELEGD